MRERWVALAGVAIAIGALVTACGTTPWGADHGTNPEPNTSVEATAAVTDLSEPESCATELAMGCDAVQRDASGLPLDVVEVPVPAIDQLEAVSYEVVREFEQVAALDETVSVMAVADSGDALVTISRRSDYDADLNQMTVAARIGAWTEDGVDVFPSAAEIFADEVPRQSGSGVITKDYFVWEETTSANLYESSWRVFARPRSGGPVTMLARSEQMFPEEYNPHVAGWYKLVGTDDRVAWHTAYRRADRTIRTAVVSVDPAAGDLRVEEKLATLPAASDAGWVVMRLEDVSIAHADPEWQIQDPSRMAGIDLITPTGEIRPLVNLDLHEGESTYISDLAAGGRVFAWVLDDVIYVGSIDGDVYYRIDAHPDSWTLEVCGDRVHWTHGLNDPLGDQGPVTMMVFDPATAQIGTIETEYGSTFVSACAGEYASWTETIKSYDEDPDEPQRVVLARWTD